MKSDHCPLKVNGVDILSPINSLYDEAILGILMTLI
jgi:hypothetical protein